MPKKTPQLAKLTRPRLHKAVARERLFAKLDDARTHKPAICVVGPPGAGKTTLVASWLDARSIKGIWYQVDPGDADLATFFYYLGEATKPFTRKGQRPLPLLTPEYLHDVEGFARRLFRELFSRLPEGAMLVLDNYQEVTPEQQLHQLVTQAVDEVPQGMVLVAISRRDPPDCYARLIANDNVARLDWEELKLTLDEACAIALLRQNINPEEVARVHERSDGWAAGLVLMLEQLRRGAHRFDSASANSLREVFDYFAAQIVEQLDPVTQKSLMQISYLPRMTASMAIAITGTPTAAPLLEDLHRRHLFTDRRNAKEPVYQLHALFGTFLQHRAEQRFGAREDSETALRAARLLEESGHPDEAFPLALKGGDIPTAVAITLGHAAKLIGQGRWRIVVEWIEALPGELVACSCWLLHWHGTALIAVEPAKARALLEASFGVAEAVGDDLCQVQGAAGIIQTLILEYTKFRPMDRWIEVLRAKITEQPLFGSADAELRAQSALLVALAYRQPDNPGVAGCAQRVFDLLRTEAEVNLRTISAANLVAYGATTGPPETAHRARPLLERLIEHPEVTVLTAGWGWFILSYSHCCDGNEPQSREAVARLERMGHENGLPALVRLAAIIGSWLELGAGQLDAAQAWSDKLEQVMVRDNPYDLASSASIKVHLALSRGEPAFATEPVKIAVALYDEAGTHFHRTYSRNQFAMNRILLGDLEAGEAWAQDALRMARLTRTGWLEVEANLVSAFVALERGDRKLTEERLRQALELGRKVDCIWPFKFMRTWLPRLFATALESKIEIDFVRKIISGLGLRAPAATIESWPWSIRIYTLGQFQVVLNDKPLLFSRKTPKKPIALLKAMIAMGGRDIRTEKLVDALWPQEEGDAGQKVFDQTLHRLRRLLGFTDAVPLEDGKASLNDALIWTDVLAFEGLLASNQTNSDQDHEVFALYGGEFLPDEPDATWAVSLRERLRSKFVHQVEQAGVQMESTQRWHEAITLYLRGMDADSLSEAFYQGLMRCYAGLGNRAEALSVYRRLRQQLSIVLGMQPSSSSESLARKLQLP